MRCSVTSSELPTGTRPRISPSTVAETRTARPPSGSSALLSTTTARSIGSSHGRPTTSSLSAGSSAGSSGIASSAGASVLRRSDASTQPSSGYSTATQNQTPVSVTYGPSTMVTIVSWGSSVMMVESSRTTLSLRRYAPVPFGLLITAWSPLARSVFAKTARGASSDSVKSVATASMSARGARVRSVDNPFPLL